MLAASKSLLDSLFNPYGLGGLAARYDMSALNSLITGTGVKLLGDLSGQSGANALILPGVVGNWGSCPDSVATSITGDIDIRVYIATKWQTAGVNMTVISKWNSTGNQRSFQFGLDATGHGRFLFTADGTTQLTRLSTAVNPFPDNSLGWMRVTMSVNNGAAGNTVKFFTSLDGSTWTQLGTDVVNAGTTAIFDSTSPVELGTVVVGTTNPFTGLLYRAQLFNGIAGTLAFDADLSAAGKLATTFTELSVNAGVVTINTTAIDNAAYIGGARDLVQMTVSKQPTLSGGGALFDGATQYLKSPAFALNQPTTVYFVGQQVTWTVNDRLYDGAGTNTLQLFQSTGTPTYAIIAGGSVIADNKPLALTINGIITAIFNGALSLIKTNKANPTVGNAGASNAGGFTLGAIGAGTTNFGNILTKEILIFSTAHDGSTQNRVIQYLAKKWGIAA